MGPGLHIPKIPVPRTLAKVGLCVKHHLSDARCWETVLLTLSLDFKAPVLRHCFHRQVKCLQNAGGVLGSPTGTWRHFILFRQGHKKRSAINHRRLTLQWEGHQL